MNQGSMNILALNESKGQFEISKKIVMENFLID